MPAFFKRSLRLDARKKSPDSMLIAKRSNADNSRDQAFATIQNGNLSCQRNPESNFKVRFGNDMLPCKSGAENIKSSGLVRANVESDVSHAEHSSHGSPPSNNDTSVMGEDNGDLGRDPSHFKYSAKRTLDPVSNRVSEGHIKDSKREKVSTYGWQAMMACGNVAAQFDDTNISNSDMKQASLLLSNVDTFSVGTNFSSSICAFCQTSEISEDTGEMLHLHNGVPVDSEAVTKLDVMHVQRSCAEWGPQAYFVRETVKNLEKELCRGSKLKCCKCGLKGVALGCYAQSCRRSYHLPCASKESNFRWDYSHSEAQAFIRVSC